VLVRWLLSAVVATWLSAGCRLSGEATRTAVPPGPAAEASSTPDSHNRAASAAPTAVRLLSADPRQVVLRGADVGPGYYASVDSPSAIVHVWHSRATESAKLPTGVGQYVLLTRRAGPDSDGVISLASSAIRYESTREAEAAFRMQSSGTDARFDGQPEGIDADEIHAWWSKSSVVLVEQVLARERNFLLSLTLVRVASASTHDIAWRYAMLLEAKLLH
jgi:hypothetical protein